MKYLKINLYVCTEVFEISVRVLFNIISNCDNGFVVTQFISCYVIAYYGQKSKAVGRLILIIQRPMANPKMDFAYEVYVGPLNDKEKNVFVYRGYTLDETVAIALGFYRTSNVPNFRVVVFSVVAQSDILTFEKP